MPSSGEFRKTDKAIRIADIAEKVGVSTRLVSKVLFPGGSNNARVGQATAEKVRNVARELGYRPNLTAKQLAGGRSQMFGVLVQSFVAEISYKVLAHLEVESARHGHRLLIGQLHSNAELVEEFLGDFVGRGVDGVICFVHEVPDIQGRLRGLCESIPNIVFIGPPAISWADWVSSDLASGVHQLVLHLHGQGKRQIALLQPKSIMAPYRERLRGFESALNFLKLRRKECPIWEFTPGVGAGTQLEDIHREVGLLLEKYPGIDAIVSINDLAAMYVVQDLHRRGILVPEQIAVTGFDNLDMAQAAIPPITSMDQRPEEVAAMAIALLVHRLKDPRRPYQSVLVPPQIFPRRSTVV